MNAAQEHDIPAKILLVDDKPSNLVALESVLCGGDYTVVSVTSGSAALACLQKSDDYAVILTDVMMPIMDGFEFAAKVKQNELWRDIPIIFLTAMASDVVNMFRGYELGAVDFLQKPLEPDFVKAKVAIFVQLFRQKRIIKRQSEDLLAIERRRIKANLQTIAHKRRLQELQDIQLKVTRIFADSAPVAEATVLMLEAITKGLGWKWGALWMIDPTRELLKPVTFWNDGTSELVEFESLSRNIVYPRGSGLIGRAWQEGEPRWVDDLATDMLMPRFTSAVKAGLTTGVVAPIWVGDEIAGVAEFYSSEVAEEEQQVLAMMSDLGSRVGVYIMRKRTETDLQESNERFRLLVEGVKDHAIFMLDREGHVATWNLGAQRTVGYEAEEIIGKEYSCFFTQDSIDAGLPEKNLIRAAREGFFEEDDLLVRKDGSVFWANSQLTPIYNDLGVLKGFSKITRDITERKLAEERLLKVNEDLEHRIEQRTKDLKRQEGQLRAVADALPVLVAELDVNQRFLFANDACKKWLAASDSSKEILGRTIRDVLDLERYAALLPYIKDVLAGRRVTFERSVGRVADKTVFSISLIPEFDDSQTVARFILVASDITHYKQIEEALRRSKALADTASAAKGAFLANMSHEIRTPLGAVLGFAELIANPEITMADRGNYLAAMRRNGDLLSNIINDILDLSKVEAGKFDIELVETSMSDVLPDVTSLLSLQAAEKGIKLTISNDGPIPRVIRTDPLRLRQILLNIVGNAVKFTVSGAVDVRVKMVFGDHPTPRLAFEVSDTGPGISAEVAAKLFEPFTQADPSTKRKFGGTGLGLVLSRKLARLLGGDVILNESKAVGCTFVVTIDPGPILSTSIDGLQDKRALQNPPSAVQRNDLRLEGADVLLVEDALDNRLLVSRFLTIAGAKVDTAENGKEALEKFGAKNYSAVLMDLQMPTMDGYEAMAELKRQGTKVPVIALTAHAMKEDRLRCLAAGFHDHISKPINRQELLELLSRHLEGHGPAAH